MVIQLAHQYCYFDESDSNDCCYIFSKYEKRKNVLKDMFLHREKLTPYLLAIGSVILYYTVSIILRNIARS